MIQLVACTGDDVELPPGTSGTPPVIAYEVRTWTEPDPVVAGETAEFWLQVVDQLGRPIPDLQASHERMVHTIFVSRDLASFQHVHHEDFAAITADDLRTSTFHFPVVFPTAGDHRTIFDFAHHNLFHQADGWLAVTGEPAQLSAPVPDLATTVEQDGLVVDLAFSEEPVAGFEVAWTFSIATAEGDDVTDLVAWLGSDGHVALVSEDLAFTGHTHAWVPGIEDMSPNMTMPHVYDGPEVAFRYVFPQPGLHKMWFQFARADAPDAPFTVPFWFDVGP